MAEWADKIINSISGKLKDSWNEITSIPSNFLKAFNNSTEGYSFKKVLAFLFGITIIRILIKFTNCDNLLVVSTAVFGLITALLGMKVYEALKTKPNDGEDAIGKSGDIKDE